ncbi:MAG: hypothetical protein A2009_03445 [Tenericutes bacterium GWD2_38_27]|nr:MAG: hypothetical protein A2Y43_03485 [Tenericutes bacterium GWA2_38_26]OHE31440.1 MAG: hypothetical protein A2009_03445 [Tenericutes bacterium GWD2_38_27]HBG33539.1 16S rRNA methyltransferase [Acholeplasmataceae bacterium]HCB67290.1 16S rRNA methyltransferase [Acholeplasmataceae bacterium]
MSHYFLNDSKLDHQIKSYEVHLQGTLFRFFTDLGVFSKEYLDFGTKVLIDSIELDTQIKTVIDMGCGYGPIGLFIAKTYPEKQVYLYDINERALALSEKNMEENKIKNVVIEQSFLFDAVKVKADAIITNPPIRAGKDTVFKLYEDAYLNLNPGGIFYAVIQKKQGAPSSFTKLTEVFGNCTVIDKIKGYWILFAKKQ